MPSGVSSKAQANITAIGNPTAMSTMKNASVHSGRPSGSLIVSTTCTTSQLTIR